MRADDVVLRYPLAPIGTVLPLMVALLPSVLMGNPWWTGLIAVASLAFVAVASAAAWRTPTRLSADGLHVAADRLGNRYHPVIPWEQVARIWTDGASLRVLLHHPDAVARENLALAVRMRRMRSTRGADLTGPLIKDRDLVETAVGRFSRGRLRLERAHVDPVPGTYDIPLRDNRAAGLLMLIAMPLVIPWSFVVAAVEFGDSPLPALAVAVVLTAAVTAACLRLAGPLIAPHVIAPDGLRVRVANPFAHDLHVPWPRVGRIWYSRGTVLVHVHDAEALAGGDARVLRRLRRNRARAGADLIIATAGAGMDAAHLALAVRHRSHGTRELEHAA